MFTFIKLHWSLKPAKEMSSWNPITHFTTDLHKYAHIVFIVFQEKDVKKQTFPLDIWLALLFNPVISVELKW